MLTYPKEFENIVEKAKKLGPKKVAVVGANSANILRGVFAAQEAGFAEPILIGNFRKTKEMLEELGFADRQYDFYPTGNNANPVQYAIEMIQAGSADVLMRGNIQTRDFLLPVMNSSNHLIKEGRLVTHISVMKSDEYDRLLAVSDCTLLVEPSIEQRKEVIRNMTEALKNFGIEKPNIALLSLVEKHRETATLKVLGVSTSKIRSILQGQNVWLTVIGIALGIPCGMALVNMLFTTMPESMDYVAIYEIPSYIYTAAGTFALSFVVNRLLSRKVRTVDMVDALKGQE